MVFRKYKYEDAKEILKWTKNEREFRLWSALRWKKYPATPEDINNTYRECMESSTFIPMCLVENEKIVGHIVVRIPGENKSVIRFGFVIVDNSIRGKGYGKLLVTEAIKFAKEKLNAKKITLGVITFNTGAIKCYESVGFKTTHVNKNFMQFENESWDCAEMSLEIE